MQRARNRAGHGGVGGGGGGGAVRSRSRSASRRRKENEKMDRQVLQDLETSMKESSMVLDRRRTGREAGLKEHRRTQPPAVARESASRGSMDRGRPSERQSSQQQPLPNSYAGAQAEDGSSSLRGLLNIAQSWIFNHTSRTERSVERSRAIVRKSSRHT